MIHLNLIGDDPDPDLATFLALFDDLAGEVILPGEQVEVLNRPGVNGSGLRRLGERGKPFELSSTVYVPDWDYVATASAFYKTLVGAGPLHLVKQSVEWGQFLVIDVDVTRSEAVANVCGDAVGYEEFETLEACLKAKWTLLG